MKLLVLLKKVREILPAKYLAYVFSLFVVFPSFAQSPLKISYQAILRDSDSKLITNSPVGMRFSILQGTPDGTAVYVETQQPATNDNGLITVEIGTGTVVSGDLSSIDWSAGPYFLKTEADPAGGTDYTITGTSQIVSVPYAFYARKAANVFSGDYNDLANAPVNVSAFTNDAGYLTVEADGDTTNELQLLSISGDTLYLSNGGFVKLPPDGDFSKSGHFVTTMDSVGIGTETPRSILEVHGRITQSGLDNSVIIGEYAGMKMNISGGNKSNVLIGKSAGLNLESGNNNTALGASALLKNVSGQYNTAIGSGALREDTVSMNTAVGYSSLQQNTSGYHNTAVGVFAGYNNSNGNENTAIGHYALYGNKTGYNNIAVGSDVLYNNEGSMNTAVGTFSLRNNTSGSKNNTLGYQSLYTSTTGHDNVAAGTRSLFANTTGSYNTAVGNEALRNNTVAFANTAVGYQSLLANTSGMRNTAAGYRSLYGNTTGSYNTATGYRALGSNTTGNNNTATGHYALGLNTEGHDNSAHGNWTLYFNTTGNNNTALGNYALYKNNTGNDNTAVGDSSLYKNDGGNLNTALGRSALVSNTSGKLNTAVGSYALHHNSISGYNTAVGGNALYNYGSLLTFGGNTAIGYLALIDLKVGTFNSALGYWAGLSQFDTYDNSTAIGSFSVITASDQVRLGNSTVTSIGGYAAWSNLSDGRFKTEVKNAVPGLAFIMKLRPVMYHLNLEKLNSFLQIPDSLRNKKREQEREQMIETGFIAQEVEKAARQVEFDFSGIDPPKNNHDYYNLRYAEFVVPLVKAVQEQQAEIEALKKQNQLLQQQIDALKNQ